MLPLPSDEPPDFSLKSVSSDSDKIEEVTLSSFKGKKVLLFFFSLGGVVSPKEFYQLEDFLRYYNLNCKIIGISTDPLESLETLLRTERSHAGLKDMRMILASDEMGEVGKKYKMYKEGEHKNFKDVVLIDEEGRIIF